MAVGSSRRSTDSRAVRRTWTGATLLETNLARLGLTVCDLLHLRVRAERNAISSCSADAPLAPRKPLRWASSAGSCWTSIQAGYPGFRFAHPGYLLIWTRCSVRRVAGCDVRAIRRSLGAR